MFELSNLLGEYSMGVHLPDRFSITLSIFFFFINRYFSVVNDVQFRDIVVQIHANYYAININT